MQVDSQMVHGHSFLKQATLGNVLLISFAPGGGGGGTPYNGLYGEAPPKRGTFFRLEVYKRVGISRAEVQKRDVKTGTFKMSRTDAPNS